MKECCHRFFRIETVNSTFECLKFSRWLLFDHKTYYESQFCENGLETSVEQNNIIDHTLPE